MSEWSETITTQPVSQWQSQEINDLAAAVVRAQRALQPALKQANNPFFHSRYADLPSVWQSLVAFRDEGIALIQCPAEAPSGHIALETVMAHTSGQWMRSRLVMPLAKHDPQGAGSALTYARRYALGCMTGLVTEEDDDGNAASHQPQPQQQPDKPSMKPSDVLKKREAKEFVDSFTDAEWLQTLEKIDSRDDWSAVKQTVKDELKITDLRRVIASKRGEVFAKIYEAGIKQGVVIEL